MLWPRALGLSNGARDKYKGPYAVDGDYQGFTLSSKEGTREFFVSHYALNYGLQAQVGDNLVVKCSSTLKLNY